MRLRVLLAFVAVASITAGRIDAQSRPDFTGTWTLVSNDPGGTPALGQTLKLAQDANTLMVEATGYLLSGSTSRPGGSEMRTGPYTTQVTHTLDGNEHALSTAFRLPQGSMPDSVAALAANPDQAVSKAIWSGRQLIVMTYRTFVMNRPTTPPTSFTRRQTVRESFQLNVDGTLAVDRLIVGEPLPWGADVDREQPAPVSVRSVYKK